MGIVCYDLEINHHITVPVSSLALSSPPAYRLPADGRATPAPAVTVVLLFIAMISIVRQLAPVVFSQREEKGRSRQWRVIAAQPSFRAMPPSSFDE